MFERNFYVRKSGKLIKLLYCRLACNVKTIHAINYIKKEDNIVRFAR